MNIEFYKKLVVAKCIQEYNKRIGINKNLDSILYKLITKSEENCIDFIWFNSVNGKVSWECLEGICFKVLEIPYPLQYISPFYINSSLCFSLQTKEFKGWYVNEFQTFIFRILPDYIGNDLSNNIIGIFKY